MESVLFGKSRMRIPGGDFEAAGDGIRDWNGRTVRCGGPIIQTGAAIGSLFGQAVGLTPYYRRVLLAAGAAAGMAATFTAPLAGILVAVELLLFELRARSFIPVAFAAAVGDRGCGFILQDGAAVSHAGVPADEHDGAVAVRGAGNLMGVVGVIMIRVLAWLETFFDELPIKYALIWSPMNRRFHPGRIGYFYPQVFGTSYDTIRDMLNDRLTAGHLVGISVAKFWALVISLGSGTTGACFAPSLVVGGGLGATYANGHAPFVSVAGGRSRVLRAGGDGGGVWRNCACAADEHRVPV